MPVKPDITLPNDDELGPSPSAAMDGDEATSFPEKWAPRQTMFFVVGVCGAFWILLAWFVFA